MNRTTVDPQRESRPDSSTAIVEPLTIFAMPKAFRGHVGMIQRNAIESWTRIVPRPEVILFGDDSGVAEIAAELGLKHVPEVLRNENGTPLIDDMFREAHRLASNQVMAYVNSDIVLFDDLMKAVSRIEQDGIERFLLVGRRIDTEVEAIDFEREDWREKLRELAAKTGSLAPRVCKDYFVFRKPLYARIPPFAIGRAAFDNWFVFHAREEKAHVIDATQVVTAVHQNHDYGHVPGGRGQAYIKGKEAARNIELAGGMRLIRGSTTDWIMTSKQVRRRRIPSDLVQFAADLPRFLRLVLELYGFIKPKRRPT